MKKQLFFLLYEDENDMNFKLVMTYVNRFIIDEDAECEVIETFQLTKPIEFEFSENKYIQKLQYLYSLIFQSEFKNIFVLVETLEKIERSGLRKGKDFQKHCIIGMPLEFVMEFSFLLYFISIKYSTHCSMLWKHSGYLTTNDNLGYTDITIGDDIDSFIETFHNFEPIFRIWNPIIDEKMISIKPQDQFKNKKILEQNFNDLFAFEKQSSAFEDSEDLFMKIYYQRRFIPDQVFPDRSAIFLPLITIGTVASVISAPYFYRKITKKLLDVLLEYFNQSLSTQFCLICLRQISLAVVIWN